MAEKLQPALLNLVCDLYDEVQILLELRTDHGDVYSAAVSPGKYSATTVISRPYPRSASTRATSRPMMPALFVDSQKRNRIVDVGSTYPKMTTVSVEFRVVMAREFVAVAVVLTAC